MLIATVGMGQKSPIYPTGVGKLVGNWLWLQLSKDSVWRLNLSHDTLYVNNGYGVFGGGTATTAYNGNRTITRSSFPYNTNVGGATTTEFLDNVFFPFVPATISLSSSQLYEVGTVNTKTLTASITANGETVFTSGHIDRTFPSPTTTKKSWGTGSSSQTVTVTFIPIDNITDSLTKNFVAYELVGNNGTPATKTSGTVSLTSCYPYLYGMSETDLSSGFGFYAAMHKSVQNCIASDTVQYRSHGTPMYAYFAFPASCTYRLSSIKDQNDFEVFGSFTEHDVNVTSSGLTNNWTEPYVIYRSNTPFFTTGDFWAYTFYQYAATP